MLANFVALGFDRLRLFWAGFKDRAGWISGLFAAAVLGGVGFLGFQGVLCGPGLGGLSELVCIAPSPAILVQTPEVYTRARLLNERITQQSWLEKQLVVADESSHFERPEAIDNLVERALLRMKSSSTDDTQGIADAKASPFTSSTPLQTFQAQQQFRQRVRDEMLRTQLDDRHDLEGNTAYTLRFPTSVLGTPASGFAALVDIVVQHPLKDKKVEELTLRDARSNLKSSFEDWRKSVRDSYSAQNVAIVKALRDIRSRDYGGLEPDMRDLGFFPAEMRDYFVHKVMCRQSIYYCPPHERERYGVDDRRSRRFLGMRTRMPGTPPMNDWQTFPQIEAQTIEYSVDRLNVYLLKYMEVVHLAIKWGYLARKKERRQVFEALVEAGQIEPIRGSSYDISFEEALERCDASPGVPKGQLVFLEDIPPDGLLKDWEVTREPEGARAISVRTPVTNNGYRAAVAPRFGEQPRPLLWVPVADCPKNPGAYATVREIFRLLRASQFGPDARQVYGDLPLGNWAAEFAKGMLDKGLSDTLSPTWPEWLGTNPPAQNESQADFVRRSVIHPNATKRVADYFNELDAKLVRCQTLFEHRMAGGSANQEEWVSCISIVAPTVAPADENRSNTLRSGASNWLGQAATTCAVADFQAYRASWPLYTAPDGSPIAFADFVDVTPVRYGGNGCDIEVRSKGQGFLMSGAKHLDEVCPAVSDPYDDRSALDWTSTYESVLCRLFQLLMQDVEFFAYALTPPVEWGRTALKVDSSAVLKTSTENGPAVLAASLVQLERDRSRSTVRADAKIVSYVRSPSPGDSLTEFGGSLKLGRNARFGWAFLLDTGSSQARNVDLSASLSLPGWMRGVRVTIRTCWIRVGAIDRQMDLWSGLDGQRKRAGQDDDDAKDKKHCVAFTKAEYDVPLPGDSEEINRKLNMDIIKQPNLTLLPGESGVPDQLRAGYPGSIVITGQRLWKNAKVTLGDQLADNIVVLPNMNGIIASFDCVNVPLEASRVVESQAFSSPAGGAQLAIPNVSLSGSPTGPSEASQGGPPSAPAGGPPGTSQGGPPNAPPSGPPGPLQNGIPTARQSGPPGLPPSEGRHRGAERDGRPPDGQMNVGVAPPPIKPTVTRLQARVWTSEGATPPIPVEVQSFGTFGPCKNQYSKGREPSSKSVPDAKTQTLGGSKADIPM